jgi:predicted O-linked N-acetylglucosamine transferase (SPINDLY family)
VTQHPLEQYCCSRVNKLVQLPNELSAQVQTIRADDLDVLLIGTNVAMVTHHLTVLVAYRLARVQATCFNSSLTTGFRNIDYYITGKLCEPFANGQLHYRERLVTLPGPGFCFSYVVESQINTVAVTKARLGISESTTVFISAANCFKLIPELRETWAKILANVPNSLVLLPFGPTWFLTYPVNLFIRTMQTVFAHYGVESSRLRFWEPLPNRAEVKAVLAVGDVYLDTYPYASTTSLIDALEVGLPTIVREGPTLRSRMGAAVLKSISLFDLVTDNEKSYTNLAIKLGTSPQLRVQKKQQVLQKMRANPPFLDSRSYGAKIGKLLRKLVKESPKK